MIKEEKGNKRLLTKTQIVQLRIADKGCAIKGLVVYKFLGSRAFEPAQRSDPRLLSTVP